MYTNDTWHFLSKIYIIFATIDNGIKCTVQMARCGGDDRWHHVQAQQVKDRLPRRYQATSRTKADKLCIQSQMKTGADVDLGEAPSYTPDDMVCS